MGISSCQYLCLANIFNRRTPFTTPLFCWVSGLIFTIWWRYSEAILGGIALACCSGFVDSARSGLIIDAGSGGWCCACFRRWPGYRCNWYGWVVLVSTGVVTAGVGCLTLRSTRVYDIYDGSSRKFKHSEFAYLLELDNNRDGQLLSGRKQNTI